MANTNTQDYINQMFSYIDDGLWSNLIPATEKEYYDSNFSVVIYLLEESPFTDEMWEAYIRFCTFLTESDHTLSIKRMGFSAKCYAAEKRYIAPYIHLIEYSWAMDIFDEHLNATNTLVLIDHLLANGMDICAMSNARDPLIYSYVGTLCEYLDWFDVSEQRQRENIGTLEGLLDRGADPMQESKTGMNTIQYLEEEIQYFHAHNQQNIREWIQVLERYR